LAEFASVVNAVQCAVDVQTRLATENENAPAARRMEFRIGVNLGDVMVDGDQIYGDGVNVAARLESLADPGGICISRTVHENIRNKLPLNFENLGEQAGQETSPSPSGFSGCYLTVLFRSAVRRSGFRAAISATGFPTTNQ
jgi:adenylate cyclase